jgi:hypothetical protein
MRAVAIALLCCASLGRAQATQASAPSAAGAPLPALLSHAQRIFIGNAGDQENADCLRAYNSFYTGLDALHQFSLVTEPSEADLVVELHYEISLAGSRVSGEDQSRQFRAVLIDGKTHVVVWSLTEQSNYARLQKNRDKNLDTVVAALVHDFASIVSPQPLPPANNSKAHRTLGRP